MTDSRDENIKKAEFLFKLLCSTVTPVYLDAIIWPCLVQTRYEGNETTMLITSLKTMLAFSKIWSPLKNLKDLLRVKCFFPLSDVNTRRNFAPPVFPFFQTQ